MASQAQVPRGAPGHAILQRQARCNCAAAIRLESIRCHRLASGIFQSMPGISRDTSRKFIKRLTLEQPKIRGGRTPRRHDGRNSDCTAHNWLSPARLALAQWECFRFCNPPPTFSALGRYVAWRPVYTFGNTVQAEYLLDLSFLVAGAATLCCWCGSARW